MKEKQIENKYLVVPMNLGANRSGIEFGSDILKDYYPEYLEDAITIETQQQKENFNDWTLKYKNTILSSCNRLAEAVNRIYRQGGRAITIGGDHSIALGSISGIAKDEENLGVVWIDAHGDMNTNDSTESGNIHGMPLAALQGLGDSDLTECFYQGKKIKTENVVILGARDIDVKEQEIIDRIGLKVISAEEVREKGILKALEEIKDYLKVEKLHISFDIDSIDPKYTPGVSTPVTHGFTTEDIFLTFNYLYDNFAITSVDIVEYNPVYDIQGKTLEFIGDLLRLVNQK